MSKITTFSGIYIDVFDPKPENIKLEDIAHHLALKNRFSGATAFPISVAQHAVYVSRIVHRRHARQALHHDDHEAYTGDIPSPVKHTQPYTFHRQMDEKMQRVICEVFDCQYDLADEVRDADVTMRRFEARFCHENIRSQIWNTDLTPAELHRIGDWEPWSWERAKREFIYRALEL